MKRFIIKSVLFLVPVIILTLLLIQNRVISFTSSISLDSKIYELKQRKFDEISTIAVGSSMTLNNLNSNAWVESTKDSSFYNISSWGQTITEDCQIIRALIPIYHPSKVVIFAHCTDFRDSQKENISEIVAYLKNQFRPNKKYFDALSIYGDTDVYYSCKKDSLEYTNLNYDAFGGAPLNVYGSHIDEARWNSVANFEFSYDNECYTALADLCHYFKELNISLILVNTPTRRHYYSEKIDEVYMHIHCCDSIVSTNGQIFIDELNFEAYPDSLFADCSHLNEYGATLLTRNVCNRLESILAETNEE